MSEEKKTEVSYEVLRERAEYARDEVEGKIKNIIRDLRKTHGGKVVVHHYHARIKTLDSAKEKMMRRHYQSLEDISDLLGYRLVCLLQEDIDEVCAAIDREFAVVKTKDYIHDPKPPERGGYTGAVHKKIMVQVTCGGIRVSVPMEVQITDVIMSAVWETEHEDNYKSTEENINAQDDNQILIGCVNTIHIIVAKRRGSISAEEYDTKLKSCISLIAEILAKRQTVTAT